MILFFFFQAEDGIRDGHVTGVQTCALPICRRTVRRLAVAEERDTDREEADEHVDRPTRNEAPARERARPWATGGALTVLTCLANGRQGRPRGDCRRARRGSRRPCRRRSSRPGRLRRGCRRRRRRRPAPSLSTRLSWRAPFRGLGILP